MTIKTLYVYRKPSGETVASIIKPISYEYTTRLRLIANTGRAITNGTIVVEVIDTDSADGWTDCDPVHESEDYTQRLNKYEEQLEEQAKTTAMLTDCILEMSERVYNE